MSASRQSALSCPGNTGNPSTSGWQTNFRVYHNTFVGRDNPDSIPVKIDETNVSKLIGFKFKNNIVTRAGSQSLALFFSRSGVSGLSIDTNLFHNGPTGVKDGLNVLHATTNQKTGNPAFYFAVIPTWPYSSSYLIGSTSEAKNQGLTLSAPTDMAIPYDLRGLSRNGAHDIGAFEN